MSDRFLVIDDSENDREVIKAIIRDTFAGCAVDCAASGSEGLVMAAAGEPDVIILDVVMPDIDGFEICRLFKKDARFLDVPVLMATSMRQTRERRTAALEAGAEAFLSKPIDAQELTAQLRAMLKIRHAAVANRAERERMEQLVLERTRELADSKLALLGILEDLQQENETRRKREEELRKTLTATVQIMSTAIETRDPYTAGHQRRVAHLARAIALDMGMQEDRVEGLYLAAQIHDLGKISIPAELLSMPRKLTDIEFALLKTHSRAGFDIVKDIDFPWPIARIILEHHEMMDGSGYPEGKTKDDILPESRVLAVADCVEAIASHRPYRPALGIEVALAEVAAKAGVKYDESVVAACGALFREKGYELPG